MALLFYIQNIGFRVYLFDSFYERITRRMGGHFYTKYFLKNINLSTLLHNIIV